MRSLLGILAVTLFVTPASGQIEDGKSEDVAEASVVASDVASKGESLATCEGGFAAGYPCLNVDLVSFMPRAELGAGASVRLNDLWGWEDPRDGKRYVLLGRQDATAFIDITDPGSPRYVGQLRLTAGARASTWRDIKVLNHYAFIVADGAGAHGMQVFDLNQLQGTSGSPVDFSAVTRYEGFGSAHNIVVNEESGFAYAVGSSGGLCTAGLHMIDISDPRRPLFAGCFRDGRTRRSYSHDAQCVQYQGPDTNYQGHEICIGSNENAISIVDVSDKSSPRALGVGSYPTAAYVHQGWLSEDHRYFYQNDELDERSELRGTITMIWDVQDLEDPLLVGQFQLGTTSIDHNLYTRGDFLYEANYTSGLQILDISDPVAPFRVASFDTTPGEDAFSFNGTWSVYPYFSDDTIALSSRDEGLFLVRAATLVVSRVEQFDSRLVDGGVRFAWTMASQSDVASFELERLVGEDAFEVFGQVAGGGTADQAASFEIMSSNLPDGLSVVRLVAVASTGRRQTLLEENVFSVPGTHVLTESYPNPTSAQVSVRLIVAEPQRVVVEAFDSSGRLVSQLHSGWVNEEEELLIEVDTSSWPAGTYFLRLEGGRFSTARTLVVIH